ITIDNEFDYLKFPPFFVPASACAQHLFVCLLLSDSSTPVFLPAGVVTVFYIFLIGSHGICNFPFCLIAL
ncbi:hypothetical protein DXD15_02860, partial [Blautia sp. TF11-31AT]